MDARTVDGYVKEADLGGVRAPKVIPHVQGQGALPRGTVDRLGTTLLIGRYASVTNPPVIYWATAPDGRRFWMFGGMYRVWLAVEARLRADRDLKVGDIAIAADVSRGYASKVIRKLATFGFIQILGVFRGHWGRVIAKLRNVSSLVRKQGGNIETRSGGYRHHDEKLAARRQARFDDPWGSWRRSLGRTLAEKERNE